MANSDKNLVVLQFPLNGIELSCPFDMQPPLTTPIATNVRGLEPLTQRDRGAQRPGLSRYLGRIPTASKVQFLGFIVDPQADALIADTDEDTDPGIDYIDDPSTNNLKMRNPGRRVRRHGSGRQSNINIGKQAVIITWANPADIVEGTALSGTQLNATAATSLAFPVPGTFVYTPSAGAVLDMGSDQPLATAFTPTDGGLYRTANKTVFINVVPSGIAFVQSKPSGGYVQTFDANVASGHLLIVGVSIFSTTAGGTVTVTDSQGNSYAQAGSYKRLSGSGREVSLSVWYAYAGATGDCTVTAALAGAGSPDAGGMVIGEYSGVAVAGLDGTASASGAIGTSPASGSVAVSLPGGMILGFEAEGNGDGVIAGAGSGFTGRANGGLATPSFEDRIGVSSATNTTWAGTAEGVEIWVCIGVSFKKAT